MEFIVVIGSLIAINSITFVIYGLDKHYAKQGYRRIPESILLLFALMGGSPAAFLARQLFRHKTKKSSFVFKSRLIVSLQICLVVIILYSR